MNRRFQILKGQRLWTESCFPKFLCWSLNANVIVFEMGALRGKRVEMILKRCNLLVGLLPLKKRPQRVSVHLCVCSVCLSIHLSIYIMWEWLDNDYAGTLISDFKPPEIWEYKFQLVKPPTLWYFFTEVWAA